MVAGVKKTLFVCSEDDIGQAKLDFAVDYAALWAWMAMEQMFGLVLFSNHFIVQGF